MKAERGLENDGSIWLVGSTVGLASFTRFVREITLGTDLGELLKKQA